jgi:Cd2+/Zn2+-exporting ATPase
MTIREYDVTNLHCADCSARIEDRISAMPEVSSVNLDFMNRKLVVQYHEEIGNALERLNQVASSVEPGVKFSLSGEQSPPGWNAGFWGPLALGAVLLAAMQFLPAQITPWLGLAAYLAVGHRILFTALKSLLSKQIFNEHLLMSLATVGALILGEYLEASAVMILYQIGQFLEDRALEHSRRSIRSMLSLKPDKARLKTVQGTKEVRVGEVEKGETVVVHPGERIPLDGIVRSGQSSVDTSSLTGESEPLFISGGSEVLAGFINNNALIEVEVTSVEAESTISRILGLIQNASSRKSNQEKFITRFARYYTPSVVVAALLVFLIPVALGAAWQIWFRRALIFLIISCPCALVISIPLSYFISIGKAAKRGIILKGSAYLDQLRKVTTVVFDKTGTLTTGDLKVEKLLLHDDNDPRELMDTLFLCEHASSHPFAKAIKLSFQAEYDSRRVNAYSEYPGKGVLLKYGEDRLIAGSGDFIREFGFVDLIDSGASSVVHAVRNDIYLGCATLSDEIRPGMKEAIAQLKRMGVRRTVMLSGDRQAKAQSVCSALGIDTCVAELLPSQKLQNLEELISASEGATAYVGDGMNDAPALARADVGIAMGRIGSQKSIETADIVLLNDHPDQLSGVFELSRRTGRVVIRNIVFALAVKAIVIALGLGGISGLWEAIIADVGVTLLVIFHSLRMLGRADGA